MKIILNGVETKNKGAELMLYAILQEVERKFPNAIVYIGRDRLFHGIDYIHTNLDFRIIPCQKIEKLLRLESLFNHLHISYKFLPHNICMGKIDYYIDASGFKFSDKFKLTEKFAGYLERQLSKYSGDKTKIIFLPQAFGPFKETGSKSALAVINKYSSCLFARDQVSYDYLEEAGFVDMNKVRVSTDFTSLVEGLFPQGYERLRGGVCIIPNMRMIDKVSTNDGGYFNFLISLIEEAKNSGRPVYLLNHEGKMDGELCYQCQKVTGADVVTELNALEVKGLIASAYLVVTSRFHGLVSALNECVPSLATSWSHKYDELFRDYGLESHVLSIADSEAALESVRSFLAQSVNDRLRKHLSEHVPIVKDQARIMWETVWNL